MPDPLGAGSRPRLVDVDDEDGRAVGGQLAGDAGVEMTLSIFPSPDR